MTTVPSIDVDHKSLHLGNMATDGVDMNHPIFRLMGEQQSSEQQNASFEMDLQSSMAPWAVGMRDLNMYAQSWDPAMPSPVKDVQLPPGMDAWAAIGDAAGKTGLTPGLQQYQHGASLKSEDRDGQLNQLSLTQEQMSFRSVQSSAMNSASDQSTLTPSTASSSNEAGQRQTQSVGAIDQSHIPLWLRRQNCDYTQSRYRGQSAPDLHGTYATQHGATQEEVVSHNSTDRIVDQMQMINSMAAQSQRSAQSEALTQYLGGSQYAQELAQQYLSAAHNFNTAPLSQANLGKLESVSPFNLEHEMGNSFASVSYIRPASDPLQQSSGQATKSRRMRGYSNCSKASLFGTRAVSPKSHAYEANDMLHGGNDGKARPNKGSISKVSVTKRCHSSDGSDGEHGSEEVQMRHVCPHPGCDKHFSTSGHARRHSRIHDDLRPYECPHAECHATFTRRDNCTQHQRARHGSQLPAQRLGN